MPWISSFDARFFLWLTLFYPFSHDGLRSFCCGLSFHPRESFLVSVDAWWLQCWAAARSHGCIVVLSVYMESAFIYISKHDDASSHPSWKSQKVGRRAGEKNCEIAWHTRVKLFKLMLKWKARCYAAYTCCSHSERNVCPACEVFRGKLQTFSTSTECTVCLGQKLWSPHIKNWAGTYLQKYLDILVK